MRLPTLRETPATLPGVSGRPILACAASKDKDSVFAGDQLSETGAAVINAAVNAVTPSILIFLMKHSRSVLVTEIILHRQCLAFDLRQVERGIIVAATFLQTS